MDKKHKLTEEVRMLRIQTNKYFNTKHGLLVGWLLVATAIVLGVVGVLLAQQTSAAGDPLTATQVRINGVSRDVDGVNQWRGENHLAVYTRSASQTVTPTNQYGIEVTVDQATHKVTAVNHRLATRSTAGTPIPDGSYVLSGHGWGVATGGYEFLVKNAQVGSTVELTGKALPASETVLPAVPDTAVTDDVLQASYATVGSAGHGINGVNVPRGENQLILYTRTASQKKTPTNQYGIEVTVSQSTGKVTAINNRLAKKSTAGTSIPDGSYVLSGHGWGVATGGYEFLLKNAKLGAAVQLAGGTAVGGEEPTTPTPTPEPEVTPTTPSTQPSTGVPSNVVAGYWNMWNSKPIASIQAEAPQYNLYYLAFAVGSEARDGAVSFDPTTQPKQSLKADIAQAQKNGSKFVISIGGGAPIHDRVRLNSKASVDKMYNSLVAIIDEYKLDGIDYDIECGSSCMTARHAADLAQRLVKRYGDGFIISMAPRPYEIRSSSGIYAQVAKAIGSNLDYIGMQYYDSQEYWNATTLANYVANDLNALKNQGIPTSKVLLGAITYSGHSLANQPVSVYQDIYRTQKQRHDLRGAFVWDMTYDQKTGWEFARGMGQTVRGL